MECIFCQIIAGKIPSQLLYQDEEIIAFHDIDPQAPVHLLVIPRSHLPSLAQLAEPTIVTHMVEVANQLAKREGISESGYRLVINCGRDGGQVVPHLHMHLLGGRRLSDQMG